MMAYILDTETTDNTDAPDVIQLAIHGPLRTPLTVAPTACFTYKPTKPITPGAMAVHHIIAADLEHFPLWAGFRLPTDCAYLIGHQVDYDWKAIGSPPVKRICTLALARHFWPDDAGHSLAACIYRLYANVEQIARELVRGAHDAIADVHLCLRLLMHFYEDQFGEPLNWEEIWRVSEEARIPKLFTFGKCKGEAIAQVRRNDPSYVSWLLSGKCEQVNNDPYLRQALTR